MSTVTASASNVERSASFLAKQASARNTPNSANSQPFAALLMAAEEPEADGMFAVRALQTNSNDDNTDKKETSASKAVAGQDALAGLLNWQALNVAAAAVIPSTKTAPATATATASIILNAGTHSQNANIESMSVAKNDDPPPVATGDSVRPQPLGNGQPTSEWLNTLQPVSSAVDTTSPTIALPNQPPKQALFSTTSVTSLSEGFSTTPPATSGVASTSPTSSHPDPQTKQHSLAAVPLVSLSSPTTTPVPTTQVVPSNFSEPVAIDPLLPSTSTTTGDLTTRPDTTRTFEQAQRQATGNPAHSAEWMVNASNSRTPPTRSAQAAHTGSTRPGLASAPLADSANSNVQEPMALQRTTVELVARAANVVPQNTVERANTDGESVLPDKVEGSRKVGGNTALSPDGATSLETSSTTRDAQEPSATQIVSADQMTEMLDELTGQIAYWASQGTQKARLTVGDPRDGLMEVDVSMRDGEVHVAFEAARDAVSDALINSAESLLRGMLENQGMTLGDVTFTNNGSLGGQQGFASQQSGNGPSTSHAGNTSRQRAVAGDAGTSAMANIPRRPDIATAEKVDLFA